MPSAKSERLLAIYAGSQPGLVLVEGVLNQILTGEHDNAVSSVPETGSGGEFQCWRAGFREQKFGRCSSGSSAVVQAS